MIQVDKFMFPQITIPETDLTYQYISVCYNREHQEIECFIITSLDNWFWE